MNKKILCAVLCLSMAFGSLAGCGQKKETAPEASDTGNSESSGEETSGGEAPAQSTSENKYEEFLTVDVFDSHANYQGIQPGWFGEIVKQKFNMELNIIAPNVAGGGDTLFQTRSAAGNIGDIILTSAADGRLQDMVTAGLILDMADYMQNAENLKTYDAAIDYISGSLAKEPGKWCIPSEVSTREATVPLGGTEPNCGAFLRWDLYKELGYPEINTMEDLLPIMQQMQELCPTSDSGKPVYAFSLFADWDGDFMGNAGGLFCNYGYNTIGYVMDKVDGSEDPVDILSEGSDYLRTLQFLNKANQMGLLDPESTTQNYDTLYAKYQDGAVLYTLFPWIGATAYNTEEHTSQGKGFAMAEIKDQKIRNWGCYSLGNSEIVAMVGSKAKDPQRMVDFLDWLYSPEGIACGRDRYCGPENVLWEMKDGEPVLTELGEEAFFGGDATMPEEYGGGSWKDGSSQLTYKIVSDGETNPENGVIYNPLLWDSYNEKLTNPVIKDWQEKMGATTAIDFLEKNDQIMTSPGIRFAPEADSTEIATLRTQCSNIIKEYSWKAVFAGSDSEYEGLIAEMKEIVTGLGYADIVEVDMAKTMAQREVWDSAR